MYGDARRREIAHGEMHGESHLSPYIAADPPWRKLRNFAVFYRENTAKTP
jgi:hypothetical protein